MIKLGAPALEDRGWFEDRLVNRTLGQVSDEVLARARDSLNKWRIRGATIRPHLFRRMSRRLR